MNQNVRVALLLGAMVATPAAAAYADAGDTRVVEAVKSGDRPEVRKLIKARANVNVPEVDGTTALHWAVRAGDRDTAMLLLHAGAKAGAANRYGVTPLTLAATNGDATMLELLLDAGADANTRLPDGETVLMTAARSGVLAALRILLDRGADVNAAEQWQGETALMWAAAQNHAEAVTLLVQRGAQVNGRSKALTFPKFNFNGSTMVSTPMPRGAMTALMFAARQGALESVRALTGTAADPNLTDPDGTSALQMAIINGHYDVAALLLENGADPNLADASGMAALYAAVDMHTAGPLINRPSRKPTGTLDVVDLVTMLLDYGANPNAHLKTPTLPRFHNGGDPLLTDGATPLMRAAKSADVTLVRLLLDHGADPGLATKNFTTALMFAAGLGSGRNRSDNDAIQVMTLCLDRGADVNAFNVNGLTALHVAVERSDQLVRFLAEHGAELDVKDKDGRTPLDIAMGVQASAFQGRRGAAPAVLRESTAALLRQLASGSASESR